MEITVIHTDEKFDTMNNGKVEIYVSGSDILCRRIKVAYQKSGYRDSVEPYPEMGSTTADPVDDTTETISGDLNSYKDTVVVGFGSYDGGDVPYVVYSADEAAPLMDEDGLNYTETLINYMTRVAALGCIFVKDE